MELKYLTRLLALSVGLTFAALVMIGARFYAVSGVDWQPTSISLGQSTESTFRVTEDDVYEVEIFLNAALPQDELIALVSAESERFSPALEWRIESNGDTVAKGSSAHNVYVSTGGRTTAGRVKRQLLGDPFFRDEGGAVRGIGAFRARPNQDYRLVVTLADDALPPTLAHLNPSLDVRLSRRFWARTTGGTLTTAYAGYISLGLGIAGIALYLLLRIIGSRSARDRG